MDVFKGKGLALSMLLLALPVIAAETDVSLADFAAEEAAPSTLSLDYQHLSDGADYSFLTFELAVSFDNRISLGIGRSRVDDTSSSLETDTYLLGFSSYHSETIFYSLDYEHWNAKEDVIADNYSVSLDLSVQDWEYRITPELRYIKLYSRELALAGRRHIDVKAKGLSGGVSYYGLDNWSFAIDASAYDYDKDVSLASSQVANLFLSSNALATAYSFLDHRIAVEAAYYFPSLRLAFEKSRSESAVDNSRINGDSLKLGLYLFNDIDIELEAGRTRVGGMPDSRYSRMILTYTL